tara:strand:+ start:641 stop:1534 length:894 start_codon:yes stop_codon:yes gene_type:complete
MKIIIAGGTGTLGQHLVKKLEKEHQIFILTRSQNKKISENINLINYSNDINKWSEYLKDSDVVINLVGESIANRRWSQNQKQKILNSRLESIQKISKALKIINHSPKVIMNASAVGYYKSSYNVVDESGSKGTDFLSHVCDQWEKAALDKLGKRTQRLVLLRIGIVLESNSGMLSKMIVPFKLCLGAIIGSGKQYIPWIHINDIVGIINYLINSDIKGPVNLVSPKIDNNFDFSKKLGRALHRIVMLRVPSFLITLLLGEMSTMVLKSSNIKPDVILKSDYKFEFENLDDALNDLLS